MLYQLSYFRLFFQRCKDSVFPVTNKSSGDFIVCFLLPMLGEEDDVVLDGYLSFVGRRRLRRWRAVIIASVYP